MSLRTSSAFTRTASAGFSRRSLLAGGVSIAALAALSACAGGGESGGGASTGQATIWGLSGTDEDAVLAPALSEWNKANTDSQLKATYFANDAYKTKIRTAVGAGSAPTLIYSWAGGTLQTYAEAGKVVDLTEQVKDVEARVLPSVFGQGVIDGKTYAVPYNAVTPILFYWNSDVLKKADVDVPESWDDILATVPKLKDAGVAPFSLAGGSKWPELMWEEYLVDRVGGPEAFNAVMAQEKDAWSNEAFITANTMIQELVDAGGFIDGFSSVTADSNADIALLYTGKAAMMLQGAWVYTTFKEQAADFVKSGLGYSTFPSVSGGKGDQANVVGNPSGYYSVSADASEEQQAAAVKWLTEGVWSDSFTKRMLENNQVPPLADVSLDGLTDVEFGTTVYDLVKSAPNFQMSWDQALPPAQATALLSNLDQLFAKQITPQQFSDNMNKTIGS